MTVEETKEAIKVMQAFVDGRKIEQKNGRGEYSYLFEPRWNWDDDPECYRVKPEPHYRPFESAEEVMEAIREHGDWLKGHINYIHIVELSDKTIWPGVGVKPVFYKTAFDEYRFADGTPFGKLVEE